LPPLYPLSAVNTPGNTSKSCSRHQKQPPANTASWAGAARAGRGASSEINNGAKIKNRAIFSNGDNNCVNSGFVGSSIVGSDVAGHDKDGLASLGFAAREPLV
jgi:hypothetical protein